MLSASFVFLGKPRVARSKKDVAAKRGILTYGGDIYTLRMSQQMYDRMQTILKLLNKVYIIHVEQLHVNSMIAGLLGHQ